MPPPLRSKGLGTCAQALAAAAKPTLPELTRPRQWRLDRTLQRAPRPAPQAPAAAASAAAAGGRLNDTATEAAAPATHASSAGAGTLSFQAAAATAHGGQPSPARLQQHVLDVGEGSAWNLVLQGLQGPGAAGMKRKTRLHLGEVRRTESWNERLGKGAPCIVAACGRRGSPDQNAGATQPARLKSLRQGSPPTPLAGCGTCGTAPARRAAPPPAGRP